MTRLSVLRWALPIALILLFLAATFVALGGPTAAADTRILFAMQQRRALVPAARFVTELGGTMVVLPVTLAAAAWLLYRGARKRALILILLLLSQRTLVEILKHLFDRARPDPHGHLVAVHSMAFPSGHSANAMALGLGLAFLVAPQRYRLPALVAGLVFALLVGASRMILGVHWPSDVAGGWALAAAWTLLLVRLAEERPGAARIDRS
jgi:undecaprenyl-diphosphatase